MFKTSSPIFITRRLPAATKDQSPASTPLEEPSTSGYQDNGERRPHRSTRSHTVHDGSTQGSQLRNGSLRNGQYLCGPVGHGQMSCDLFWVTGSFHVMGVIQVLRNALF